MILRSMKVLGVGKRGRGDIRHLLIQGAQAVLSNCRAPALVPVFLLVHPFEG
jgi:hypothetical protein